MKISLIVPVFNEADTIQDVLEEFEKYMINYSGRNGWEIIIVNDGSTDNTIDILKNIKKGKNWLRVVDLKSHYGRGRALRAGFNKSKGEIIVTLDADLSYATYHIERLIKKLKDENADIVLASAYGKGGTAKNVPWRRLFLSKMGNKILSYMFGYKISVLTCLVRAYKSEFLKRLDLNSEDKEIHLEILYKSKMLNAKVVEIPADLKWREQKLNKIYSKKIKRRSTIKVKKTSSSHLFFALISKPGLIFWIPGFILFVISIIVYILILNVIANELLNGKGIYASIRLSMINGTISWFTATLSFVLGIQFFTIGFLSSQNKKNYEETYKTLSNIYSKVNKA